MTKFSSFELQAMALLVDGQYHEKSALAACLDEGEVQRSMITIYIARLRTKLEKTGISIQCTKCSGKESKYRLVRVLGN